MPTQLAAAIGRQPSEGELYIAHFLGSDGASKLINVAATQPRANAAAMFPQAASANPSIFLNRFGLPRSAGDVYSTLTGRFEVARAGAFAPDLHGSTTAPAASPDTAGVTQAFAQANDVRRLRAASAVEAVPVPSPAPEATAVLPDHVHRSRQPGGDANREQSVDAGQGRRAGRGGAVAACSICSPTRRPHPARRPAARSERSRRLPHR